MFRITASIVTRRLLYRHARPDVQTVAITSSQPNLYKKIPKPGSQEREPCPISPPPPPKPKDDTLFWAGMAMLCVTGGFIIYAKSNPEIRDWLTINASWIDDLIAIAHQENMTYSEFAKQIADDLKSSIVKRLRDDRPKQCSVEGKPVPDGTRVEKAEIKGDYVIVNLSDVDSEYQESEELGPCEEMSSPILTKDICEIERCVRDLGDAAVFNYMTARDASICYNKLVAETMDKFSYRKLKELHEAQAERIGLVKESVRNGACAAAKLDELERFFSCGVQAPKEAVKNTKDLLKEYKIKIKTVRIESEWENEKALAEDVHWQKVEMIVDKYTDETRAISNGLDYMSDKPQLRGDPDLLLHHTLRYVNVLKEELSDALMGMTERVNRGIDSLPQEEKLTKAREAEIQALYKKKLAALQAEFKKRYDDNKANNDKCLKDSLKNTKEQAQVTLVTRLKEKTDEVNVKLDKMVAAQAVLEKKQMANELSNMATKLKVLEDKLNARLKAERETRRSQELWCAGASLLAATKKGDPYVKVDKELRAIEKASGDGDKLVLTVLKAIPQSVREKGVVPESVLREKYHVMEDTALKVALVEQEGASLPTFFLSYLQSIFLFMKISGIPQSEFEKPPKEPAKDLDTFDLLQRARFWVERGNIALALKYVTALEGASLAAAASWQEAARSHLETRQAAEAVLAHAAAMGLQYI